MIKRNSKGQFVMGSGTIINRGYIMVYFPNHPYAKSSGKNKKAYVYEHRLIIEKKIGRYLKPYEVVHHINGIRDDNRVENLQLLPNNIQNLTMDKMRNEIERLQKENKELKIKISGKG